MIQTTNYVRHSEIKLCHHSLYQTWLITGNDYIPLQILTIAFSYISLVCLGQQTCLLERGRKVKKLEEENMQAPQRKCQLVSSCDAAVWMNRWENCHISGHLRYLHAAVITDRQKQYGWDLWRSRLSITCWEFCVDGGVVDSSTLALNPWLRLLASAIRPRWATVEDCT